MYQRLEIVLTDMGNESRNKVPFSNDGLRFKPVVDFKQFFNKFRAHLGKVPLRYYEKCWLWNAPEL